MTYFTDTHFRITGRREERTGRGIDREACLRVMPSAYKLLTNNAYKTLSKLIIEFR
jgi:hypothetical protein